MFDFTWLLKLIYFLSRLSGFLHISIDFCSSKNVTIKRTFWKWVTFGLSFCFSLIAMTYDDNISISEVMHSKMMEIAINSAIRISLYLTCGVKFVAFLTSRSYFLIIANFQWSFKEVSDKLSKLINHFLLFSFKSRTRKHPWSSKFCWHCHLSSVTTFTSLSSLAFTRTCSSPSSSRNQSPRETLCSSWRQCFSTCSSAWASCSCWHVATSR